jgi:hypothetical protein
MLTAGATTIRRLIRTAAAAIALALLVGGLASVPAGASSRDQNVIDANNFIDWCFNNGGSPDTSHYVDYGNDIIYAYCLFPDGSSINCQFWLDGTTRCWATHPNGATNPTPPPPGVGSAAPPLTRPPSNPGQPGGPVQTGGTPLPNPDGSGAVQTGGTSLSLAAQDGGPGNGATARHSKHGHGKAPKGHHRHGNKK